MRDGRIHVAVPGAVAHDNHGDHERDQREAKRDTEQTERPIADVVGMSCCDGTHANVRSKCRAQPRFARKPRRSPAPRPWRNGNSRCLSVPTRPFAGSGPASLRARCSARRITPLGVYSPGKLPANSAKVMCRTCIERDRLRAGGSERILGPLSEGQPAWPWS